MLRARSETDLDIDPVAVMQVLIRSRSILVGHNDDSALKTWSEEYTSLAASMYSLRESVEYSSARPRETYTIVVQSLDFHPISPFSPTSLCLNIDPGKLPPDPVIQLIQRGLAIEQSRIPSRSYLIQSNLAEGFDDLCKAFSRPLKP